MDDTKVEAGVENRSLVEEGERNRLVNSWSGLAKVLLFALFYL